LGNTQINAQNHTPDANMLDADLSQDSANPYRVQVISLYLQSTTSLPGFTELPDIPESAEAGRMCAHSCGVCACTSVQSARNYTACMMSQSCDEQAWHGRISSRFPPCLPAQTASPPAQAASSIAIRLLAAIPRVKAPTGTNRRAGHLGSLGHRTRWMLS